MNEKVRDLLGRGNAEDIWEGVMLTLIEAAEAEASFICNASITPDERTHSAGRLDAFTSAKRTLEEIKKEATKMQ